MITYNSKKREISDLQRLLTSLGLIPSTEQTTEGVWDPVTQAGVNRLYDHLGWNHPNDGRWVTAPALAAIASALHQHALESDASTTALGTGGGGSHTGGGGSHTGAGSTPE